MRRIFEERRDYIVSAINSIDGVSCIKPDGAFYVMLNISRQIGKTLGGRVITSADDFALALLEKEYVAAVSCVSFGAPNFLRLTYAASMNDIKEGVKRIENFVSKGYAG